MSAHTFEIEHLGDDAPAQSHSAAEAQAHAGPTVALGFWIYLMSDCILFAGIFATYAVLSHATAGGPDGHALFDLPYVFTETMILLASSITYGMGMLAAVRGRRRVALSWLGLTALLGLAFLAMELNEFHHMIAEGAGPDRSAFLSAFFTLVGTHGLHVTAGLLWLGVLMAQVAVKGLSDTNLTRLNCLSMFWHFLDVIWIGVFTIVYLLGVL